MKLLALAALASVAAAELSTCITTCAENITTTNTTACPTKEFESQDCLCEYGFTSDVRKCMYTACPGEVTDWVAVYRGADCPEGTYSATNGSNPHSNTSTDSTGGASPTGTAAASDASASSPVASTSATGGSGAAALGIPVFGAVFAAAIVAAL